MYWEGVWRQMNEAISIDTGNYSLMVISNRPIALLPLVSHMALLSTSVALSATAYTML